MKIPPFLGFLFFLASAKPVLANEPAFSGTAWVRPLASPSSEPLFRFERKEFREGAGKRRIETRFIDLKTNSDAVRERLTEVEGQLELYQFEQLQLGESGEIRRKNAEVEYRYTRANGKTEVGTEKVTSEWVVGPLLLDRLRAQWSNLQNQQEVRVRIGVIDRQESFGFRFVPDPDRTGLPPQSVRIWLKPTSPFISLLVKPIEFWLTSDGARPLRFKGRTLLKVRDSAGKWMDLDAVTEFR